MDKACYDVVVIGAGVIGVSIFNDLARCGIRVALLEKELDVSTGTTKANSGIIHAGFDAEPGTLKAKLNVIGNAMYPEICERLYVPLVKCGAYVIGSNEESVDNLLSKAKINGVKVVKKLRRKALLDRLPNIADNVKYGLYAENSYIIEPYLYTISLAEEAVINGGKLYLGYEIKRVTNKSGYYNITDGKEDISCRYVINCAGSKYNDVAKLFKAEQYKTEYRRGEYYVLDHSEKDIVPATIFPLPDKMGKGVLVTPTVSGNILVGPTSYVSEDDTKTTDFGLNDIRQKVSNILTNVNLGKAIRIFSGVRTVVGNDFVIERSKKAPGVVNVAGICSPGLSSAPAISRYIMKLLGIEYKPKYNAKRIKPYTRLSDMTTSAKNRLIAKNSDYGKIVCKCEGITVGEIKDAINRPIRPTTMDGIKRRIRPGMGRCQGGFCNDKVAMLLAKENGVSLDSIVKEKKNGNYIAGNIVSRGVK